MVGSKGRVLFWIAATCFAASFPDYPVKPVGEYPNVVEKSGLAVAFVPMEDPEEQRKYFGINLQGKGYLPVLLVMENRTSTDSFLLSKEDLAAGSPAGSVTALPSPVKPSKVDKTVNVVSKIPSIYGLWAMMASSKNQKIKQNMLKSELHSATLSPGASAHGFVFVPAHWKRSVRDKIQLTVPFTKI